jgi:hypothetical protein
MKLKFGRILGGLQGMLYQKIKTDPREQFSAMWFQP